MQRTLLVPEKMGRFCCFGVHSAAKQQKRPIFFWHKQGGFPDDTQTKKYRVFTGCGSIGMD